MLPALQLKRTMAYAPPPQLEGVLIEVDGGGGRPLCSSGVRWGQLVISHGCLLPPGTEQTLEGALRPIRLPPESRLRVQTESDRLLGRVRASWRCPLLAASGRELAFKGWNFISPRQQDLAHLVVLQVGEGEDMTLEEVKEQMALLLEKLVAEPQEGQPVLLEATPFGAGNFFLNSWTKGIINKVAGKEGCLLLCDAHAAPGSEGGGLYCLQDGQKKLVGLVVQTLLQVRGEAVSLCLCASAKTVLAAALDIKPQIKTNIPVCKSEVASRGVVLLKNGNSWASAVALDSEKGIFLTCAHVIQGSNGTSLALEWPNSGGAHRAEVIYKCPSTSAFDVAILKTAVPGPKIVPRISKELPDKGEIVEVVGYGLLSPPGPGGTLHSPLVSRGCISHSRPQMLQTSCAVHSGNSGGAVFKGAALVGLVVGHTEINSEVRVPKNWPKINFAVPMAAIYEPIDAFIKTGDKQKLKSLENFDSSATRLWTLNTVPNSKL